MSCGTPSHSILMVVDEEEDPFPTLDETDPPRLTGDPRSTFSGCTFSGFFLD